jgi:hypothetical protein
MGGIAMIEIAISAPGWIWWVIGGAIIVRTVLGTITIYVSWLKLKEVSK